MKDKFIITLSDVNGSKQYTLSQFIKVIASWIVIAVVITFAIGGMLVYYLSHNVDELNKQKRELVKKQVELKQAIKSRTETLEAMNEQLVEAKKLIGLDEDKESKEVSEVEEVKEVENTKEIKESATNKDGLTEHEFKLLSRLIPNGKPLEYRRISTKFGFRRHPITKRKQFHPANDLAADLGTPIYAPADGVVVYAGKKKFYGNFLLIRHGFGFATAYGHLHRIGVKTGEYVKKGELVALCGNTGRSTGPHVHYELRYLSKWLDPEPFMKKWSYETYKEVMKKNKQVNWEELIKSLKNRIQCIKILKK